MPHMSKYMTTRATPTLTRFGPNRKTYKTTHAAARPVKKITAVFQMGVLLGSLMDPPSSASPPSLHEARS